MNFNLDKNFDKSKIKYITLDNPFPNNTNEWQKQAVQREHIIKNLDFANKEDYIFFSDPDEIPNPKSLKNFNLKKKIWDFYV